MLLTKFFGNIPVSAPEGLKFMWYDKMRGYFEQDLFIFFQNWISLLFSSKFNFLVPSDVTYNWVNIGSSNGLLADATEPFPEPMLTCHQWSPVLFTGELFHWQCVRFSILKPCCKITHLKLLPCLTVDNVLTHCGTLKMLYKSHRSWSSLIQV